PVGGAAAGGHGAAAAVRAGGGQRTDGDAGGAAGPGLPRRADGRGVPAPAGAAAGGAAAGGGGAGGAVAELGAAVRFGLCRGAALTARLWERTRNRKRRGLARIRR